MIGEVIRVKEVSSGGRKYLGLEVNLPGSPPLVLLVGETGFAMCGFLDVSAAEKKGVVAVKIPGVSSVEELLEKEIAEATSKAEAKGLRKGVRLKDVLDHL